MIPAVLIRLLLLLVPIALQGDSLEEAVRLLADKITVHLETGDTPRVVERNLSSMPLAEAAKAQAALQRALPKHKRNGSPVEITLTVSENVSGYLLVAEIRKKEDKAVEMVSFTADAPATSPALLPIAKRLVWEQDQPILDLTVNADQMLVLGPKQLTRYERSAGRWLQKESAPLAVRPVRDPRGRLEVEQDRVTAFFPGATCRGTWQPMNIACQAVTSDFILGPAQVHFTPGRNTLEGVRGLSLERLGEAIPACGDKVLASENGSMESEDTIALFDGATPISDAVKLPGPVTALWPAPDGALAVVLNVTTKQYAAYALSVDCGR